MSEKLKPKETKRLFFKHIVRKIFLEDWAIKLTALVITFGLWFGVTGLSTPTTQRLIVPLNLNISSDAEITNTPLQEVEIVISGDKRRIDQLNRAELFASLDLTDVLPGDRLISLSPETVSVTLPPGIKFDEITQTRIFVRLEAVEEKDVDVRAVVDGEPADGYEIYSSTVLPQKIRVRGPASFIRGLETIETTETIGLSGRNGDFSARQVPVGVGHPKATVLNTVVDVYFRIGEKRIERAFSIPVSGSPERLVSFVLFGARSLITRARLDDFEVEIADDNTPQLTLPSDLRDLVEVRRLSVR